MIGVRVDFEFQIHLHVYFVCIVCVVVVWIEEIPFRRIRLIRTVSLGHVV